MIKRMFSAPGRIEIGGNHTDHQHGRVLAAAIDLEVRCTVKANGTNIVHIHSEGFGPVDVDLSELYVHDCEKGTTVSLVRGVAAWFCEHGYSVGGFDGEVTSTVPTGAGLSSSAAFEVMIGNVLKGLFDNCVSPLEIAIAGQHAENVYFGKPCGLMDQMASSFGGLAMIDFENPIKPVVNILDANLDGYSLCVVDTGGSHADLTNEYAAITQEMKIVARFFSKEFLRDVNPDDFYSNIVSLRRLGDRPVLRALHFFEENERVASQAAALTDGDIGSFLDMVIQSGQSSLSFLQNVYAASNSQVQGLTLAYALSERILRGKGAWRVHGGGFAGTILAFVPDELKEEYNKQMSAVFGENACHFLNIRKEGGMEVTANG